MKNVRYLLFFTGIVIASTVAGTAAPEGKPNYIVILADDLGYNDLGCYGSPNIRTPHLDKMAAEGLRFTDFYVGSPVCSPSRAALLTGCYPVRLGLGDELKQQKRGDGTVSRSFVKVIHSKSAVGLNPEEVIIPEMLKPAGYKSGITTAPMPAALYNLEYEPNESKSVLVSHPEVEARLKQRMEDARVTLGDTLTGRTGNEVRKHGVSANPVNFTDPRGPANRAKGAGAK